MLLHNFRKELQTQRKKSYALDQDLSGQEFIDCSEGINPFGVAFDVKKDATLNLYDMSYYPHNKELFPAITNYWKPVSPGIKPENILLIEGSLGGLSLLATAMAGQGSRVLGIIPQFPDFVSLARLNGISYEGYELDPQRAYQFYLDEFLPLIHEDYTFIYIDNPNNPTGQLISLSDINQILKRAASLGIYVVVDEAYGDFVSKEESAISLLHDYDNLIILRTMSKGFGLAGLRAGYMISDEETIDIFSQLTNPYVTNAAARKLMVMAFTQENYLADNAKKIQKTMGLIKEMTGHRLKMSVSDDRTPICLLEHINPDVSLHELLLEAGILAIGPDAFEGLRKNSVRLRMPREEYLETLLQVLRDLDNIEVTEAVKN